MAMTVPTVCRPRFYPRHLARLRYRVSIGSRGVIVNCLQRYGRKISLRRREDEAVTRVKDAHTLNEMTEQKVILVHNALHQPCV